jgi:hypothetical protein
MMSCSLFSSKQDDDRKVIAKVYDSFLYEEDIKSILPEQYTKNDSILLVSGYINNWAKHELLLKKALINLKSDAVEIQKLVDTYKKDLIINKYREAVVSQNLDTVVNDYEIDDFYEKNKAIFKLNEELIKLKYIQHKKDILNPNEIFTLFNSTKEEDLETLKSKKLEFVSSHFNDSVWIKYSDLRKAIPVLSPNDIDSKLKYRRVIVMKDSLHIYLLKVNDILNRQMTSPKSYVKLTIKQMILHNKKLKLLKNIEQTLLNDANKNGQYEIYN